MLKSIVKRRTARAAAGLAAAALVAGSSLVSGPAASADPKQFGALVGVGSDTTQDVLNGLAGESNGISYTPVKTSTGRQLDSWDAIGTGCITPKAPGASFDRPNGSGQGVAALSRTLDGANWGTATCGAKPITGLVDFARSSSGPVSGTNTGLTYIPFGRDGVSFGYYVTGGTPVTQLTKVQLNQLLTGTGPLTVGTTEIYACGIQTNSGTHKFWLKAVTGSNSNLTADTNTATCNNATTTSFTGNRIEENDGAALKAKGDALKLSVGHDVQVIIGFSAAKFISMTNTIGGITIAPSTLAGTGVDLGDIDPGSGFLGKPYTTSGGVLSPSTTFYNDGTFGREVYNVLPTAKVTGAGNADLKEMFVAANGAKVCAAAAQATVNTFGFTSTGTCGTTTQQGATQ